MPDLLLPDLLEDLRRRRPEAVALVVRRYAGDLLGAALGFGHTSADAEELVQETFSTFLEAAPRFEGRSSVRTFLFGILYNKMLERGRERSKVLAMDPTDRVFESRFTWWGDWSLPPKGPEEEAAVSETARLISECLSELPPRQRAAFQLKEVQRLSNRDICNVLRVRDTHLRVLLFRARTRLRECLERKWG